MAFADSRGVRIYYETVGSGFPVVLQTGGGGDGRMWELGGYIDGLSDFRCILVDHRGHGRSDKPVGVENHLVERYGEDIITVLDDLEIERAAFFGYSAGTWTGFSLAASFPERIAALVALGPGMGTEDHSHPSRREDEAETAAIGREHGVAHFASLMDEADRAAIPQWFWDQMASTDGEMFALEVEGAMRWDGPWSLLSQVRCPVLLIAGSMEDPDGNIDRAAERLANGRSVTLDGLGHLATYVRSDLVLEHAVPFLRATAERDGRVSGRLSFGAG